MAEPTSSKTQSEKRSKSDQFFIILIFIFFSALAWMLYKVQTSIESMKVIWKDQCEKAYNQNGFNWPTIWEFKITIVAAFACYILRVMCD